MTALTANQQLRLNRSNRAAFEAELGTRIAAIEAAGPGSLVIPAVDGVVESNKLVAVGANKELDTLALPVGGLKIGAGAGVAVTASAAELNTMTGITATAAELNVLAGTTVVTAQVEKLATVTSSAAELNYVDITALGTGAASKAVVLNSGEDYVWPATGVLTYGILKDPTATAITSTATELNNLASVVAGTTSASKALVVGANKNLDTLAIADSGLKLGAGAGTAVTSTAVELNKLASVAAGTVSASKAIVVGADKNIDTLAIADSGLKLGAGAGTAVTSTAAELNKLASVAAGTVSASKAIVVGADKNIDTLAIADSGLKLGAGAGTAVTSTAVELNKLASVAAGTVSASKAVVVGADKNLDVLAVADLKLGAGAGTSVTATAAEINAASDLTAQGMLIQTKKIAITSAPTGAEQDSTFDLPARAVLLDVYVDVTTAEVTGASKTLDVGLLSSEGGGDANGFVAAISVAAAGTLRAGATLDGTFNWYVSNTRGALMSKFAAGANADDRGLYMEFPHMATAVAARSVTFTAASADWAEFRGSIYLVYAEIG